MPKMQGLQKFYFELFDDKLEVSHNGRLFNEPDVRGICGVDEGTKAEDLTQLENLELVSNLSTLIHLHQKFIQVTKILVSKIMFVHIR